MTPHESAEVLDAFLLEDRAMTLRSMRPEVAADTLAEMHPNMKAILLSAVGDRERQAIMGTMTPRNVGTVLSALPVADCIAAIKTMPPQRAADAIMDMVPEERAVTIEAIAPKDRAAIVSCIGVEEAAYALARLLPDDCAATLRYLEKDFLKLIMMELPVTVRDSALIASPVKWRARAMVYLSEVSRASVFNSMPAYDLPATVKSMPIEEVESTLPYMDSIAVVQTLSCLMAKDAVRMLNNIAEDDQADIVGHLPPEIGSLYIKTAPERGLESVMSAMDPHVRAQFLSVLPDKVKKKAVKGISTLLPGRQLSAVPEPFALNGQVQPGNSTGLSETTPEGEGSTDGPVTTRSTNGWHGPFQDGDLDEEAQDDRPVLVSVRFEEDYDWICEEASRRRGWADWVRSVICKGVKVSSKRTEVVDLQRGSVILLLRVLPLSMAPNASSSDSRTAADIANQMMSFVENPKGVDELPRFLGGSLKREPKGRKKSDAGSASAEAVDCPVPPPRASEAQDDKSNSCGVGVAFAPTPRGKHLSVIGLLPGGDAERSGVVSVGDRLFSVDSQEASELPIAKLAQRVRGKSGTTVVIGFQNPGTGAVNNVQLCRLMSSSSPSKHAHTPESTAEQRKRPPSPPKRSMSPKGGSMSPEMKLNLNNHNGFSMPSDHMPVNGSEHQLNGAGGSDHIILGNLKELSEALDLGASDVQSFTRTVLKMGMPTGAPETPEGA